MTKDERYLIKLRDLAQALGSPWEEVDRYAVGQAVGLNDKAVDNAVRLLAQANFLKKGEGDNIILTQNGLNLINLLQNK